jgi:hypothetical protein
MMANGRSFFGSQQSVTSQIAAAPSKHGPPRVVIAGEFRGFTAGLSGGFQADDLSDDIFGGLINDDIRDVAVVLISHLE